MTTVERGVIPAVGSMGSPVGTKARGMGLSMRPVGENGGWSGVIAMG